jgi:glycosyltransferase involved in cell wall biosynthesis
MQIESLPGRVIRARNPLYIYMAGPWGPRGGGMFKVVDYLIQAQDLSSSGVELRALDTRGGASPLYSLWVLATALAKLLVGRLNGQLAGVHVNIAGRLSLFRKSAVVIMSRMLGIPVVLHLHAHPHPFYHSLPPVLQALTRWVFSLSAGCVVLGTAAKRFVIEDLGVPPEHVQIVCNGVPEPTLARRKIVQHMVQRVLFVGSVSDLKGVSDLLQALALSQFDKSLLQVSFAGAGNLDAYRSQAQQLGINDLVRFEGWSDQQQVAHLMALADVLILPSYVECLPLVILEAMSNGVAVVCSPVGEIPSVLTDGVNACFVQPGDVAGIAAGLQRVLRQPAFREALERNGRALYEQQFSLTRFFANIARVHQRFFGIAGRPQRSGSAAEQQLP